MNNIGTLTRTDTNISSLLSTGQSQRISTVENSERFIENSLRITPVKTAIKNPDSINPWKPKVVNNKAMVPMMSIKDELS